MIRNVKLKDAEAICNIYNYYIANSTCTFETVHVSAQEMQSRISDCIKDYFWIVFEENDKVVGYAYAKKWHQRQAYKFTLESSVYVSKDTLSKGIGAELYCALFKTLKTAEFRSVLAVITLPNPESIKMHEKFGFTKVGHLKKVGFKFNEWIDVGFWQLEL